MLKSWYSGSTFAASAQIVLFLEMLKFSKISFLKGQIFVKENEKYFEIFWISSEINSLRLINYLVDMSWSHPWIVVVQH